MSIEVQALRAGHEAALRFAVNAADEARDELESTRRVLAVILADHGPFPYPTDERIAELDDDDGITVRGTSPAEGEPETLMIMFESAEQRIEGMREQFDNGDDAAP